MYTPSVGEVKAIFAQSKLFDINHMKTYEINWDPRDDLEVDEVQNSIQSGMNVSKSMRAVFGPLLAIHFGESLMDELFDKCAYLAAQHLEKEKGNCFIIGVSLERT